MNEIGTNSITNNPYKPYDDYKDSPFPSGLVDKTLFFNAGFQWWMKSNISIFSEINMERLN